MKISQKLEYACRAMVQLAKQENNHSFIHLDELAQREAISANFLVQILNDLRRAGLVTSRRGANGGYCLSRPIVQISLKDIVESIEPQLLTTRASTEGESGHVMHQAWQQVSVACSEKMAELSLQQLIDANQQPMFYI